MGLLSFLKRKSGDAAKPSRAQAAPPESADTAQHIRTRARQRLIGAVVLVGAGVIGFPLLFETQPRPLPVDIPIEISRKDGSVLPSQPAHATALKPAPMVQPPNVVAESTSDATPASAPAPAVVVSSEPVLPAASKPAAAPAPTKPAPVEVAKPAPPKPAENGTRAQALLEGKDAKKPAPVAPTAAAEGRFIVQVGAFAEASAAREVRQKVEKLGLKTYTQVVETSGGKRIRVRVGPFTSHEEADKAAAKIKSAGLAPAVYTL